MKKKRLLFFIALLLMAVMGAKADGLAVTSNDIGKVICTDGSIYATKSAAEAASKTPAAMIAYIDAQNGKALGIAVRNGGEVYYWDDAVSAAADWGDESYTYQSNNYFAVGFGTWSLPTVQEWQMMLIGCGAEGTVSDTPYTSTLSYIGINNKLEAAGFTKLSSTRDYWSLTTEDNSSFAWNASFSDTNGYARFGYVGKGSEADFRARLAFDVAVQAEPEAIGLKVTIDDIGKVICTDGSIYATESAADAASKTPAAMIAYVDARNGKALGIALWDADQGNYATALSTAANWGKQEYGYQSGKYFAVDFGTWKLPTIQEWQQMLIGCGAEGIVSDNPSSGTSTLSFTGLNSKLDAAGCSTLTQYNNYWSATADDFVVKTVGFGNSDGFTTFDNYENSSSIETRACLTFDIEVTEHVTVYEGLKITTADIGKFICPDGSIYATWSAADNAGKTAVAMIAYVDEENHKALGMSLYGSNYCQKWADAESQIESWAENPNAPFKPSSEYLSWKLPTIQEWQQMLIGCGAAGQVTDNPDYGNTMSYSELKAKLENGNASWPLPEGYYYFWTATENNDDQAWCLRFSNGTATFEYNEKANSFNVSTYVCPVLSIAVYGESVQEPEPEPLSLMVTTDDLGKVVCTDGSLYSTITEATGAGKTPAGMIAYVDMEHETGLAIALDDEREYIQDGDYYNRYWNWATASAKVAAHTPALDGTIWKLPSMEEWQLMLESQGSNPETQEPQYSSSQLNNWLYNAGCTTLDSYGYTYNETDYTDDYWTSSVEDLSNDQIVWCIKFWENVGSFRGTSKEYGDYEQKYARACFAFNVELNKYAITIDSNVADLVQCNKTKAAEGETVGVTVTNIPEGQYANDVFVYYKEGDDSYRLEVTPSNYYDDVFTFTMPAYPVTIGFVEFVNIPTAQEIDGIYYIMKGRSNNAEVAPHPDHAYRGDIRVPGDLEIGNKIYYVTSVGREAFAGYDNGEISSVTLGKNVGIIKRDAFYNTTLTSLSLGEHLKIIEQYAFRNGNYPIDIPSTVDDISRWAFKGFKGTQMSVDKGNATYDSRYDCNAIIETASNTIVAGNRLSAIPEDVTTIGEAAYDGVGLSQILIPSNITTLEVGAYCNNPLTSVFIPKTVTTIYNNPFYGCNQLRSIEVEEGNPKYDSRDNCNAICDKEKRWVISTCRNTVIPKSITGIGTHAFAYRADLNEFKVPAHVTYISDNAFAYSNLWNVSMADNDELYIGQWAFGQCKELRMVKIGRGIREIDQQAFLGCLKLSNIYVNAALAPKVKNLTFEIDDAGNTYSGKVHVPAISLKSYQRSNFWKDLDLVASEGVKAVKASFKEIENDGSLPSRGLRKTPAETVNLITEEGAIWSASGAAASAFSITTYADESCLQISSSQTVTLSNRADMGFTISGPIKSIVVRAAGNVSNITCEIIDISSDADNTTPDQAGSITATTTTAFEDYTVDFSGKEEYSKAKVNVIISGQASTYIAGINIIQGAGDNVVTEGDWTTVDGLEYANTLSAPANAEDAEAIIDGAPVYVYTTCLPTAPQTGAGLKYYTLSGATDTSLQFQEIEGAPVADTPYLVAVSETTDIAVSIPDDEEVTLQKQVPNSTTADGFTFVGTTTGLTNAEAATAGAYILQDGNVWGLVTTENYGAYIPPFRAYIVPANSNARPLLMGGFVSGSDETTTISTLQLTDRDGTTRYFDLNGRRIASPATKGVYVVNGKKVLIKK